MKKNAAVQHSAVVNQPSDRRRKPLPRAIRYLSVLLLMIALLISIASLVASFKPFVVVLPTPMFAYRQSTRSSYSVNLSENPYFSEKSQPAGRTYLREFTRSVSVRFDSTFSTILSGNLVIRSRVDGILKVHDTKDASVILLEKPVNLLPATDTVLQSGRDTASASVEVPLQPYQEMADAFLKQTGLSGSAELVIRLTADAIGTRYGQVLTDHQESAVTVPLLRDQFQIVTDDAAANKLLVRPVRYRFHPDQVPLFVFPLMIGFFLVLLVLVLTLTRNQKADHFKRDVDRMLRYARRQLLLIGDKAWEPEWCITASDFKSLVRTARKLKHPVFGYINNDPEQQAAYFYVYYGENNYCYTFKSGQAVKAAVGKRPADSGNQSDAFTEMKSASVVPYNDFLQDDVMDEPSSAVVPLLPETDDSTEVILERIRREPGSLPF